jgi:2-keto-4-pentenoate hydratase
MAGLAAERILTAWRSAGRSLSALPETLRPGNLAHAYAIQEAVNRELGAIGGWRICVAEPASPLLCAPVPLATVHPGAIRLAAGGPRMVRAQPVLCLRVGHGLADYDSPFTRQQAIDAIESASLGAEILGPHLEKTDDADQLTAIAESCGHAALVHGRSVRGWRNTTAIGLVITTIAGRKRTVVRRSAGITSVGEMLQWLANDGARWGGGLQVGQLIVIALQTAELRIAPGMSVQLAADGLGTAEIRVADAVRSGSSAVGAGHLQT